MKKGISICFEFLLQTECTSSTCSQCWYHALQQICWDAVTRHQFVSLHYPGIECSSCPSVVHFCVRWHHPFSSFFLINWSSKSSCFRYMGSWMEDSIFSCWATAWAFFRSSIFTLFFHRRWNPGGTGGSHPQTLKVMGHSPHRFET